MVFIIFFTLLFAYQGIKDGIYDWFMDITISLLMGCVGFFVGFGVALLFPADNYTHQIEYNIVSLQDGRSLSGRFFLGTGNIDEKMQYAFYYKKGNAFKLKTVEHDKASIYYTDSEPIAIEHKTEQIPNWKVFYAIDLPHSLYDIKVPEGTIKTNYRLDAN